MLFSKVAKFQFPSLKLTVVWIVSQHPETAMTLHNARFILSRVSFLGNLPKLLFHHNATIAGIATTEASTSQRRPWHHGGACTDLTAAWPWAAGGVVAMPSRVVGAI
jgi:hypothetical protein